MSEDRAGGSVGVAAGSGDGVRVGAGEGGTDVAVGCEVTVGTGEGNFAVCVGRGCLAEQPTMRPIPIAATSASRTRSALNLIQMGKFLVFIVTLSYRVVDAGNGIRILERDGLFHPSQETLNTDLATNSDHLIL